MSHLDPTGADTTGQAFPFDDGQATPPASAPTSASAPQQFPRQSPQQSPQQQQRHEQHQQHPQPSVGGASSDPTGVGDVDTGLGEEAGAGPIGQPLPPALPLRLRAVSGRYRGVAGAFQLELRVDVDRTRPMNRVSADFFQLSGGTTAFTGSFVIDAPVVTVTPAQVTVRGTGRFTFAAGAPVVQVTIARRSILQPQAPATVQFFTTGGAPGASYGCNFESVAFRTVRLETDRVSNVATPVFASYDTGLRPSGGPARNLSVVAAYAEAGIEMIPTGGSDVIPIAEAAGGATWSNAELHASMQHHFSLWQDQPRWAVWQVVAQLHDIGPGLYGIMFDQQGKQRQGCAVFHQGIGGSTAEKQRLQLYTYVHELGHCFNLLHSWQKSLATPPKTNRPLALSWMNYPFNYPAPGGEVTYWNNFAFQFDNEEVVHLRHAFRNDIVMGGGDFAVGSSLGRDVMPDPIRDDSGLTLTISTRQRKFALGEPVVLELALWGNDARGRRVHTWLHPNCNLVQVVIKKPNGTLAPYEPMIEHLVGPREAVVRPGHEVRDSAYIGYGRDGLTFEQPGRYQVRAAYTALDGSVVMSKILDIRVAHPVSADDEAIADLFMGDEQGALLYLLGSDDDSLQHGNDAFDEVLARFPDHPMANYARLVKGVNAGRDFKTITRDAAGRRVAVRRANVEQSTALLGAVVDASVLDPVSQQMALSRLAEVQSKGGDEAAAASTRKRVDTKAPRLQTTKAG